MNLYTCCGGFTLTEKMWCIDHTEWPPCDCKLSDWLLLYRYTADEMTSMVEAVSNRANCLERWIERADAVLAAKSDKPG